METVAFFALCILLALALPIEFAISEIAKHGEIRRPWRFGFVVLTVWALAYAILR